MTTNEYRSVFRRFPDEARTILENALELYIRSELDLPAHTAEITRSIYTALIQPDMEPEKKLHSVVYDATDVDSGVLKFTTMPQETRSGHEIMMYYLNTHVVPGAWKIDDSCTAHGEDGRRSYVARLKKPAKQTKKRDTVKHLSPQEQILTDFANMTQEQRLQLLASLEG